MAMAGYIDRKILLEQPPIIINVISNYQFKSRYSGFDVVSNSKMT